ncbi:uncharacterized protein LACBIDRAFT_322491 [Laccaria bicolor S238N-H82]|uniref:Predicted protein n=1 Tax=Laccaria bicolor (strain S238N-H82 / ATCC MYA-4686) TaxID=486041 RepID=B0CWH1_LACBS|nr:uncharacterized protein LACBIDRAFT_322491 [Laccaria bicolor S238N-H82]EDR13507.1 predicted protein [Laccaria bicolor S238N-H82]|eukprot:XP_001876005.1 predicted protein [Laccaria bicolor S238N-H82]
MTIWSLLGIPPPNPYPKGTRVWYNMCSGGLMFATVDSTGRLPDLDTSEAGCGLYIAQAFLVLLHHHGWSRRPKHLLKGRPIFTKFWTDTTTWDVWDYAADLSPRQSGSNEELEKKLLARFPPIYETAGSDIPYLDQPCHITDRQGHILLWYFPEMFSEQLRTFIWDHTGSLSPKKRSNGTWRDHHPENEGVTGIVNLSPSWFSQGHEGPEDPLHTSADIQEPANSTYLQNVLLANAIVGAIYAVIQPDLFESGLATFKKLANHAEALDDPINIALRVWATPFTGLSVILNREMIDHRDLKGYMESFDLLLTIGNYTGGWCHLITSH